MLIVRGTEFEFDRLERSIQFAHLPRQVPPVLLHAYTHVLL